MFTRRNIGTCLKSFPLFTLRTLKIFGTGCPRLMSSKSCLFKVIADVFFLWHQVNTSLFAPEQQTAKTPLFYRGGHIDDDQLCNFWLILSLLNPLEADSVLHFYFYFFFPFFVLVKLIMTWWIL